MLLPLKLGFFFLTFPTHFVGLQYHTMQNVLYMAMTEFRKVAMFILKLLLELRYLCQDTT